MKAAARSFVSPAAPSGAGDRIVLDPPRIAAALRELFGPAAPLAYAPDIDPTHERAVREAYGGAGHASCPRCGTTMTVRAIGGGSFGLGYARRREWLICPTCRRSVIFDIRRGTRN